MDHHSVRNLDFAKAYDDAAALDRALADLGAPPGSHPWALARLETGSWDPQAVAAAALGVLHAEEQLVGSPAAELLGLALTAEQIQAVWNWLQALVPGFRRSALDLDLDYFAQRAEQIENSLWPFGRRRRQERLLDELADHLSLRSAVDTSQLVEHFGALKELRAAWTELQQAFSGSEHSEKIEQLASALFNDGRPAELPLAEAAQAAEAWGTLIELLGADDSSLQRWAAGVTGEKAPLRTAAVQASAQSWRQDCSDALLLELSRWAEVSTQAEALRGSGLAAAAQAALTGQLPAGEVEPALRRALTEAALQERLHTTGLHRFDQAVLQRHAETFTQAAAQRRKLLRDQLPAELLEARGFSPEAELGAVAELQRQIGRRRGGLRIRQLFENYGELITAAAPCLLMSPDSVARFLPAGSVDFDVVVFDEASQIRVPEAIGAMGRGKSVVIVGDTKQMPPSQAFAHSGAEESEDALVPVDLDSILSEAHESGLPRLWLTWHYRSKDESLVAFSNRQYYQGRLSTFPAPPEAGSSRAIQLKVVDGLWEGGRGAARVNRVEAEEVLLQIQRLLEEAPEQSIGVVTFNVPQRDLLLDMLESSEDPKIQAALSREDEPLFVKNLENVQGDERDTVIFTLAFSRDAKGRVPLQWGAMTAAGGERRLNVAITRAREKVRIISSFHPRELDLRNSASQGLADLKEYLLAAEQNHDQQGNHQQGSHQVSSTAPEQPRDMHHAEVQERLEAAGLEVLPRLGLSDFHVDFALRSGDRPWVAVLLDDPAWGARRSVGDRESLPQSVLIGTMGWAAVERIWLPEWLRDPQAVVSRICRTAEQADPAARPAPEPPAEPRASSATPQPAAQQDGLTVAQRHVEQVSDQELREVMVQVLRQAFRASQEDLLRSTARLYGHQRMGTRIQQRLEGIFTQALSRRLIIATAEDQYAPAEDAQ